MDSEAHLDIDEGHIEILSSQHDLQAPQAADGGQNAAETVEAGARGDIKAAHELDLDLRMIDVRHGDVQLFHQESNSNSQKYASGSKGSQAQDDTPGQRGYADAESSGIAERAGLYEAADSSGAASSSAHEQQERYHQIGKLASDLPIIESRSDEVSSSSISATVAEREAS